ncbi:MAG: Ig domain-containing protein [Verrucomicrobiales bacterium]
MSCLGTVAIFCESQALDELVFEDRFGRRLNEKAISLVDWEGQIANPAVQVSIKPPPDATFPAGAVLSSPEPRLYFNEPSQAGVGGPSKNLSFQNAATQVPFLVSVFPDRNADNEEPVLTIRFTAANGMQKTQSIPVRVLDQDKEVPHPFKVTVNFSQDQTGFFNDGAKRSIIEQAASDWAYFFSDMNLDTVAAQAEQTFIWNSDGFNSGRHIRNANAYRGFLLYAYGIHSPALRSGGEPSFSGGFQHSGGTALPLKRSGGVEIETAGNFNELGWFLTTSDDDWWKARNFGNEQNDLYSIAHHEIGHSLIFNPSHTRFGQFKNSGKVEDAQVLAYQKVHPPIDSFDHLDGSIDRLSRKGAFGYEYFGEVPRRRWLVTKLDLLVAQAVGYTLRATSAFAPLDMITTALPRGTVSGYYSQVLAASGGIPSYEWAVASGTLPPGLFLDSFTGEISGQPTAAGTFGFTVRLRDHDRDTPGVSRALNIRVETTPLEIKTFENEGADARITFTTVAGRSYRVEFRSDLASSWTTLANNVPGTGDNVIVIDTSMGSQARRFYRVIEL